MAPTTRITGVVASWNDDRGFGFITPDGGGANEFVHISAWPQQFGRPKAGDMVSFEVQAMPDGRTKAVRVQPARISPVRLVRSRRGTATTLAAVLAIAAFAAIVVLVQVAWRPLPLWVAVLYLGASAICFTAHWIDKSAATSGGWRVPEGSLLALGVVGGWPGGLLAQQLLRHKTRKVGFRVRFWVGVLLNVIGFVFLSSPLLPQFIGSTFS